MDRSIIKFLKSGYIGVLPTDTIYGIVASAWQKDAVEKIYQVKKRNAQKPFIILIGSIRDLKLFGIKPDDATKKALKKFWPGPVSVLLSCSSKKWEYLHRGKNRLAFRLPKDKKMRRLLSRTGPLVAPSANQESKKPAQNIAEAQKYFGSNVDFYVDGGEMAGQPSALVEIIDGKINILRKGIAQF